MNLLRIYGLRTRYLCCFSQRLPLTTSQKSSRNDYMKSGLYSTFTIQSLQVSPSSQPVKTELVLQPDPVPKVTRMPNEVWMGVCSCRVVFLPGFLFYLGVLVVFCRCVY